MTSLIQLGYLASAILFILGLKALARPRTAVRGNLLGSAGMLLAVVVTLADQNILTYTYLAVGLALGAIIGTILAVRVQMTGMPQLVALFNGFGGLASLLVGAASYLELIDRPEAIGNDTAAAAGFTLLIGAVTFTGSLVAFGKLQEIFNGDSFQDQGIRVFAVVSLVLAVGLAVAVVLSPSPLWMWALIAIALLAGIALVAPIGGADTPVVIALLNSFSGLAAATTGFVLGNSVLIIAGSMVGASGLILTQIMCKAMNRTLFNVMFSSAAVAGGGGDSDDIYTGKVTSSSADEVALILDTAQSVAIIPGYGMAVAQAQHAVRDLTRALEERGADVVFAIHPVAGRMPGHMNVLLAEAEVPYEQLKEMEHVNPQFDQTDVSIIIGANDVVNPSARQDPTSPIAGMPILDADKSRTVVVIKRSLSHGFAGIPNPLFAADNTLMLFGDGKAAVEDINRALAEI